MPYETRDFSSYTERLRSDRHRRSTSEATFIVRAWEKSLKEQLIGTWIYVSSTAKREDGAVIPRPSAKGAVTYTADGRFHFITTATDAAKYGSSDPTRPSADEAMA